MPPPPSVHRKLKTAQRVDGRAEVGRRSQAVRLLVAEGPRGGRGISGSRGGAGGSGGEQQRRSSSAADGSMTLHELADDTSTASDRTVSPALLTETRAESGAAAAPPHLYDLAPGHPGLAIPSAVLYSTTTTDVDVRCGRSALRGRLQATPLEFRHASPEPPLETPAHTRCASFAQCIDMCAADTGMQYLAVETSCPRGHASRRPTAGMSGMCRAAWTVCRFLFPACWTRYAGATEWLPLCLLHSSRRLSPSSSATVPCLVRTGRLCYLRLNLTDGLAARQRRGRCCNRECWRCKVSCWIRSPCFRRRPSRTYTVSPVVARSSVCAPRCACPLGCLLPPPLCFPARLSAVPVTARAPPAARLG